MRETELLAGGNYAKPYLDLLQAVDLLQTMKREALELRFLCRTQPYLDVIQPVKREALRVSVSLQNNAIFGSTPGCGSTPGYEERSFDSFGFSAEHSHIWIYSRPVSYTHLTLPTKLSV